MVFAYSYEQMLKDIGRMKESFPRKLQTVQRCVTLDGRTVEELVFGNPFAERHILIHGGIHGREHLNSAVLLRLASRYLREKTPSPDLCFHVLPMVNPDGCTISMEGPDGITSLQYREFLWQCYEDFRTKTERETGNSVSQKAFFSRWKANVRGVDLNRNFAYGWKEYEGPSCGQGEGYRGAAPESERETRAILDIQREYPLVCCISYHSSGNLVYWDYGCRGKLWEKEKRLAKAISRMTGYPCSSTVSAGTDKAGCSDYFVMSCKIPAVTVETGVSQCPLPANELSRILGENKALFSVLEQLSISL